MNWLLVFKMAMSILEQNQHLNLQQATELPDANSDFVSNQHLNPQLATELRVASCRIGFYFGIVK